MALNKKYDAINPFDGIFDMPAKKHEEPTEKTKDKKAPKLTVEDAERIIKETEAEEQAAKAAIEQEINRAASISNDFMNPPKDEEDVPDNTTAKGTQLEDPKPVIEPENAEKHTTEQKIEETPVPKNTEENPEREVKTTEESNEKTENQEAFDLADLKFELPEDYDAKYMLANSSLSYDDLKLCTCGGVISKDKLRKLERYATRSGKGRDSVLTQILLNNYESETLLDDDQIDAIIDDYQAAIKSNTRITFRTRTFLKKFLNDHAQEYGINIGVLFRYYIIDFLDHCS